MKSDLRRIMKKVKAESRFEAMDLIRRGGRSPMDA